MTDQSLPKSSQARSATSELLEHAASKLEPLLDRIVFVGGAVLEILIDDPGAAPPRPTFDVDVIVEVTTYIELIDFEEQLRANGFREDTRENAPRCRWLKDELVIDVMPTDPRVLGFSNRWYADAMLDPQIITFQTGLSIKAITAPYFLATKIEAFRGRGNNDYYASHDLEDFIAVLDGRTSIRQEIEAAPVQLKTYLALAADGLLAQPLFLDALPGYVMGDQASQARVPIIIETLSLLANQKF